MPSLLHCTVTLYFCSDRCYLCYLLINKHLFIWILQMHLRQPGGAHSGQGEAAVLTRLDGGGLGRKDNPRALFLELRSGSSTAQCTSWSAKNTEDSKGNCPHSKVGVFIFANNALAEIKWTLCYDSAASFFGQGNIGYKGRASWSFLSVLIKWEIYANLRLKKYLYQMINRWRSHFLEARKGL